MRPFGTASAGWAFLIGKAGTRLSLLTTALCAGCRGPPAHLHTHKGKNRSLRVPLALSAMQPELLSPKPTGAARDQAQKRFAWREHTATLACSGALTMSYARPMAEPKRTKRLQPRMTRGGFRVQFVLWSMMAVLQLVIMVGNLLMEIV